MMVYYISNLNLNYYHFSHHRCLNTDANGNLKDSWIDLGTAAIKRNHFEMVRLIFGATQSSPPGVRSLLETSMAEGHWEIYSWIRRQMGSDFQFEPSPSAVTAAKESGFLELATAPAVSLEEEPLKVQASL